MNKRRVYEEQVIQICKQKKYELYETSVEHPGRVDLWEISVKANGRQIAFGFSADKDTAYSYVYTSIGKPPLRRERRVV